MNQLVWNYLSSNTTWRLNIVEMCYFSALFVYNNFSSAEPISIIFSEISDILTQNMFWCGTCKRTNQLFFKHNAYGTDYSCMSWEPPASVLYTGSTSCYRKFPASVTDSCSRKSSASAHTTAIALENPQLMYVSSCSGKSPFLYTGSRSKKPKKQLLHGQLLRI